jgi:hypothetical protein
VERTHEHFAVFVLPHQPKVESHFVITIIHKVMYNKMHGGSQLLPPGASGLLVLPIPCASVPLLVVPRHCLLLELLFVRVPPALDALQGIENELNKSDFFFSRYTS